MSTTLPLCDTPAVPAELTAAWNALVQQMIAQQTAADAAACVEAGTGASCRNNTDFGAWARWGGATSDTTSTFFNNLSGCAATRQACGMPGCPHALQPVHASTRAS